MNSIHTNAEHVEKHAVDCEGGEFGHTAERERERELVHIVD